MNKIYDGFNSTDKLPEHEVKSAERKLVLVSLVLMAIFLIHAFS